MDQIKELRAILQDDGSWLVSVTKSFAPEHGGGHEVFTARVETRHFAINDNVNPHYAVDALKRMVTVLPAQPHNHLEAWTHHDDCPRCQEIKARHLAEQSA